MAMIISEPAEEKDGTEHLCLQWHPCRDFLAVSSYKGGHGGEVNFFTKKVGYSSRKYKRSIEGWKVVFCIEEFSECKGNEDLLAPGGDRFSRRMGQWTNVVD